jgi:pentatricopeptide repeat protein
MPHKRGASEWIPTTDCSRVGGAARAQVTNALIHACAKASDHRRALEVRVAAAKPCFPNRCVGIPVGIEGKLRNVRCGANPSSVRQVYEQALAEGVEPDSNTINSLIHACAQGGDPHAASEVLKDGMLRGIAADAVTFTALISAWARVRNVDRALQVCARAAQKHLCVFMTPA